MLLLSFPKSIGLIGSVLALRLIATTGVMATELKQGNPDQAKSVYEFVVNDIKGNPISMEKYRGHPLIIVNVASKCGYTEKHYAELNALYDEYAESKGLRILAFPCDQFSVGGATPDEFQACLKAHNVKFDVFGTVKVNGDDAHPLWKYLKKQQDGTLIDTIKWDYTKFIVDKNGKPVDRFAPTTDPLKMIEDLKKYM
uniref:Glutathione peroxidase n=1 Tax=Polypedilum vanderplanki TaxID=319348 RepID=E0YL17_POLVA|nr:glutathione peroxidase 2 [Polypedilum vanderplanki]BAO18457.1 glutathione peroxidase splicing variant PvGpx-D [Polypedilum vanderplanki]BAO18460.1 glutathione peroxidase splicing variant PvGpx-D [Polypedilum vanderplanki]